MRADDRRTSRRRRASRAALTLLVLVAWVVVLLGVGLLSSSADPPIGATRQELVLTWVLLVPGVVAAFVWLGRRRRRLAGDAGAADPSRRRLLLDGAAVAVGGFVGGAAARPLLFAAADPAEPTPVIRADHGPTGGRRVLVAYEGQYGSTAEIADRVGRTLAEADASVEVRHVDEVADIDGYDLVVVGGAIQYDRWMPGAVDFVRRHREALRATSVAFFFTCLALSQSGERGRVAAAGYERKIRDLAPEIEPVALQGFAGVLDYSRMTPVARIFGRILLTLRGAEAGDHRDWLAITSWARSAVSWESR